MVREPIRIYLTGAFENRSLLGIADNYIRDQLGKSNPVEFVGAWYRQHPLEITQAERESALEIAEMVLVMEPVGVGSEADIQLEQALKHPHKICIYYCSPYSKESHMARMCDRIKPGSVVTNIHTVITRIYEYGQRR